MENLTPCEGREAPGRCHTRIQGSRSHSALRQGRGLEGGAKKEGAGRGRGGCGPPEGLGRRPLCGAGRKGSQGLINPDKISQKADEQRMTPDYFEPPPVASTLICEPFPVFRAITHSL